MDQASPPTKFWHTVKHQKLDSGKARLVIWCSMVARMIWLHYHLQQLKVYLVNKFSSTTSLDCGLKDFIVAHNEYARPSTSLVSKCISSVCVWSNVPGLCIYEKSLTMRLALLSASDSCQVKMGYVQGILLCIIRIWLAYPHKVQLYGCCLYATL